MTLDHPAALGLLALAAVFVLLSLWRQRPRARDVASLFLWERLPPRSPAIRERGRPRLGWIFVLQAATLAAIVLGLAAPVRVRRTAAGPVVILLDNTARLSLRDAEGKSRWDLLAAAVREMASSWPADREAYAAWVEGGEPRFERRPVGGLLDGIGPGNAMFPVGSLAAPAGASRLWVSDRPPPPGIADAWIVEAPPSDNVAVAHLRAESAGTYAVVTNYGVAVVGWIQWEIDGQGWREGPVTFEPGSRVWAAGAARERVRVRLDVTDAWEGDNEARAVRTGASPLKVALDGEPNEYLRRAMEAVPGVEWTRGGAGDLVVRLVPPGEGAWRPVEMRWGPHPITEGLDDRELFVPLVTEVPGEALLVADGRAVVGRLAQEVGVGAALAPDPARPSWVASPSFPIFWTRVCDFARTRLDLPKLWDVQLPAAGASDPGPGRSERAGRIPSAPGEARVPAAAAPLAAAVLGVLGLAWAWRREG